MNNKMQNQNKCIAHSEYGTGTILKVERTEEGYWITIDCDEIGEKKLMSFIDSTKEKVK